MTCAAKNEDMLSDRSERAAAESGVDCFYHGTRMNKITQRPDVGVAHVVLETDQMAASCQFMRTIGMRSVFEGPDVSVFELRGGTHLLLMAKAAVKGGDATFDLMVDDIHSCHEKFAALGLDPSPIEPRPQIDHEVFTLREPAGHVITVFSSHVTGVV